MIVDRFSHSDRKTCVKRSLLVGIIRENKGMDGIGGDYMRGAAEVLDYSY